MICIIIPFSYMRIRSILRNRIYLYILINKPNSKVYTFRELSHWLLNIITEYIISELFIKLYFGTRDSETFFPFDYSPPNGKLIFVIRFLLIRVPIYYIRLYDFRTTLLWNEFLLFFGYVVLFFEWDFRIISLTISPGFRFT